MCVFVQLAEVLDRVRPDYSVVIWDVHHAAPSCDVSVLPERKASTTAVDTNYYASRAPALFCGHLSVILPSVLWRCWLGGRNGIRPVKNEWWGAGVVICLEQGADLHMAQLMPLPLTVCYFRKIQIDFTFLVPAHLGSPWKTAVNWVCVCVCVCYRSFSFSLLVGTENF